MKNLLLLAVLLACMCACTNEADAKKALEPMGFTNVQVTGVHPLACSDDDWFHTGFTATNPKGEQVSGTVCSGILFKGSTVRW